MRLCLIILFACLPALAQADSRYCQEAIESNIEGNFEGWDGESVFKLTNGEVWQQSAYAYTYHYAYRPSVIIYPSKGGCAMKVDNVSSAVQVERIK